MMYVTSIEKKHLAVLFYPVFFLLFFLSENAFSKEYRTFHRGVRPLGMGGAFTAVSNDQNAVNFNPAGLARAGGIGLGIVNPMVTASRESLELYEDFNDIDRNNASEVAALLRKHIGEHEHLAVAADLYVGLNVENFGVMVTAIGQGTLDLEVRNPVWPEVRTEAITDYGGIISFGGGGTDGLGLSVGASFKTISRSSLDEVYTAVDIADEDFDDRFDDDFVDGSGASMDVGMIYTFKAGNVTNVSMGVAGLNIPKMDFGEAVDEESTCNVGLALEQSFYGFKLTEAVDYYDVTDTIGSEDDSVGKKVHLGAELKFPILLSLRGGLNQGYYTAGAALDFKILRIDAATYGEELGAYAGQREDRRYVVQASLGWSW